MKCEKYYKSKCLKRKFLILKLSWLEDESHVSGNLVNPQLGFILQWIKKYFLSFFMKMKLYKGTLYVCHTL